MAVCYYSPDETLYDIICEIVSAVTASGGSSSKAETKKVAPPAVTYTTLTTLSWDQDNEKVK
ncbi:unnamed protein product [Sphagnum compactum]